MEDKYIAKQFYDATVYQYFWSIQTSENKRPTGCLIYEISKGANEELTKKIVALLNADAKIKSE